MPLTKVTTAITAATPITTPSRVSTERSLLAHKDSRAMRMASVGFMAEGRISNAAAGPGDREHKKRTSVAGCSPPSASAIAQPERRQLTASSRQRKLPYNRYVGSRTGRPLLPVFRGRRGRKVRTPQSSVPDNIREAGFKPGRRKVPQKTYRPGRKAGVRVKGCGKSAPPRQ